MSAELKKIAVVGQGIIGLACAIKLAEAGHAVSIFSRDDTSRIVSYAAGAYWWPHKTYPENRVSHWARHTFLKYKEQALESASGVHFEDHFRFCETPDEGAYAKGLVDEWQDINGNDFGLVCKEAFRLRLPVIDVPTYLPFLKAQLGHKGIPIHLRDLQSLYDLFPEHDLVINCSGLGSRSLAHDTSVFPIRGQSVCVLKPPNLSHSTRFYQNPDAMVLILPRLNDCMLGGTSEADNWSLEVDDKTTEAILARCEAVVPAIKNCRVLGVNVGLRPGRKEIRLELDTTLAPCPIIHNYGHAGGGFTVAWGCAEEVVQISQKYFSLVK